MWGVGTLVLSCWVRKAMEHNCTLGGNTSQNSESKMESYSHIVFAQRQPGFRIEPTCSSWFGYMRLCVSLFSTCFLSSRTRLKPATALQLETANKFLIGHGRWAHRVKSSIQPLLASGSKEFEGSRGPKAASKGPA